MTNRPQPRFRVPPLKAMAAFSEALKASDPKQTKALLAQHHGLICNLHYFIQFRHQPYISTQSIIECIDALLAGGSDIDALNDQNQSVLHVALEWPLTRIEIISALLERNANPNVIDEDGRTPLHLAVGSSIERSDLVKVLLESGAGADHPDPIGATPMHMAAAMGHLNSLRILHANGANLNAETEEGYTPLFLAMAMGKPEAAAFIREVGGTGEATPEAVAELNCIHTLVQKGEIEFVRSVLTQCPSLVEATDEQGWTPLHHAVRSNRLDVVHLLLDLGANPNAGESRFFTPLCAALNSDSKDLTRLLQEYGAKPIHLLGLCDTSKGLTPDLVRIAGLPGWIPTADDVCELEDYLDCVLPKGYGTAVQTFGEGQLGPWRLYMPWQVMDNHEAFQSRMKEYAFANGESFWVNHQEVLSDADKDNLIRLADSEIGDEVVFVRGKPDQILVLPRQDSFVRVMGTTFWEALDWALRFTSLESENKDIAFERWGAHSYRAEISVIESHILELRSTLESILGKRGRSLRTHRPLGQQSFEINGFPNLSVWPKPKTNTYRISLSFLGTRDAGCLLKVKDALLPFSFNPLTPWKE